MSKVELHRLGEYIREVDVRNHDLQCKNLLGLSIAKEFIPSIANIIGTDLRSYKIVKNDQFAYVPVTSRNGEKITVAHYCDKDNCIISQAYTVFEVIRKEELLPDYLMLWFRRPEFDRYARFMSHGSAREVFDWDEMSDTMLPVPSIEDQRKIVNQYNAIQNRIEINKQTIAKLEEAAQHIYNKLFVEDIIKNGLPKGWSIQTLADIAEIKGGKRLPKGNELVNYRTNHPYIKVADMPNTRFIQLTDSFQYVEDDVQNCIKRYIVSEGNVIISIVGTIGNVNIVGPSLNNANLTENCLKICQNNGYTNLIYSFLTSVEGKRQIEQGVVGGVQGKLPMYNVEKLQLVIPDRDFLNVFNNRMNRINSSIIDSIGEIILLQRMSVLLLSKLS